MAGLDFKHAVLRRRRLHLRQDVRNDALIHQVFDELGDRTLGLADDTCEPFAHGKACSADGPAEVAHPSIMTELGAALGSCPGADDCVVVWSKNSSTNVTASSSTPASSDSCRCWSRTYVNERSFGGIATALPGSL